MDDLARLLAKEEIRDLKAAYFYYLDTKDWLGYETVFTEDAVMDAREAFTATRPGSDESAVFGRPELIAGWGGDEWVMMGAKGIVAGASGFLQPLSTVHNGYLARIDFADDDTATGIWAMQDRLRFPEGAPIREIHGFGHYHETYVRRGGSWRISRTKLTRLRLDVS